MQTRSHTNYEKSSIYNVDIDFNEASQAWNSNKKHIGNGMYKYICNALSKKGNKCNKKCLAGQEFCRWHRNK